MSDLSGLEAGTATFNRVPIDIRAALSEAVSALPEVPDRTIDVDLKVESGPALVQGDPVRLRGAFTAVLMALRRELVSSTTLAVRETVRQVAGRTVSWIAIADPGQIEPVAKADDASLAAVRRMAWGLRPQSRRRPTRIRGPWRRHLVAGR